MAHALKLMVAVAVLLPIGTTAQAPPPSGSPYGGSAYAQGFRPGVELRGFAGYHIASDLHYFSGSASIDGSASYGAALGYRVRPGEIVELLWIYVPTNAHFASNNLGFGDASLTIHYFQLGGIHSFKRGNLEPFLAGSLGAAIYSPGTLVLRSGTRIDGSDLWRFAFTVGGGLRIWLIDKLAVQLEARMLAPVWFSSASFYGGAGGAAFGVSGGIPVVEGNFTGGLVLAP